MSCWRASLAVLSSYSSTATLSSSFLSVSSEYLSHMVGDLNPKLAFVCLGTYKYALSVYIKEHNFQCKEMTNFRSISVNLVITSMLSNVI